MNKLLPLAKIYLSQNLIHREFWLGLLLNQLIPILIPLFVWKTLFEASGENALAHMTMTEVYTYYLASFFIFCICSSSIHKEISQLVHSGFFSNMLLRPVSELLQLSAMAAARTFALLIIASGILLLLALLLESDASILINIVLAMPNIILGVIQMLIFGLMIGSLSFWILQTEGVFSTIYLFMQFLGGVIIPIDLLPAFFWFPSTLSPFKYSIYYTAKFISSGDPTFLLLGGIGECIWIAFTLFILSNLWRAGLRQYDAAGL